MRSYLKLKTLDSTAPWLLFVLIVWLCWKLAALFWLFLAPPQAPAVRDAIMPSGQHLNVPNITGFALFKENRADTAPVPDIPLKLEGVFIASPASNSAAVIRAADKSNRYQVGQQIEGTSQSLMAVMWNHVVLRYQDGRQAELYFGDQPPPGAAMPTDGQPVITQGGGASQQTQNAIGDAVRQLQSNPSGYLNQMGVTATGQGYEISANTPADLRNKLGLRPGDRIVSLNGRPLGQVQNDVRLLEQVQQQRNAQIEIRRGDQSMTIQQSF